jgi:hypothetical protein
LEYVSCQAGLAAVVNIKCKNGELEGSISLAHPITVKKKGGSEETAATLYAQINLSKLSTKVAFDFDEVKYASTGGFNLLKTEVKGEWGASMGIKLDDEAATAEIPAWSELIRGDGANIWDENTKVKFGKYFELSGLNGDDKKGLIPLGGIYLTPANFSIGGQTFGGGLTATQLGQIKGLGMILWVYMDLSGKLSISGDFKFVDVTGGGFDRGFKLERVDGTLASTIINSKTKPNVLAPYIKGKIEAEQTIGAAVAVDVLFAGIRPVTIKSTLLGFKATGAVEGEGGYRWSPQPAGLQGSLCASASKKLFTDFIARAAVNAKIDLGWISAKGGLERSYEPDPYIWWEDSLGLCVDTFTLPTKQVSAATDAIAPEKTLVEMSFSEAYNNAQMRRQVGRWQILEEGSLQTRFFDADSSLGGAFSVSLWPGKYTYTVIAWHKDIKDSSGKPIEVARSGPLVVNVTALPTVDFSAALVGGDCTKLQLDSLSKAAPSQSLVTYKWSATPAGGSAQTQQGAALTSLQLTLPSCGSVQVTHTVTDDQGRQAAAQRSVDTTALVPKITDINPKTAVVNTPVTLTVTGNNLPSTAVLSMADANCAAPTSITSGGFSVSCTALTTGSKTVTIKANTQANGGKVIDATRTVNVTVVAPAVQQLTDSFDGASLDGAKWNAISGAGGIQYSESKVAFGGGSRATTQNKVTFSGSKIVLEGRFAGRGLNRDTHMELIDAVSGDSIQIGDTNYRGFGFYLYVRGASFEGEFTDSSPLTTGNSTSSYMDYRMTIDGKNVIIERSESLSDPSYAVVTRSVVLPQSIVGRSFYFGIGTGANDMYYSPGTFDSVSVTVSP